MIEALTTATAVFTLATVIVTLVVAVRNNHRANEIHVLVNDRMSVVLERVEQLSMTLRDADVDVPPNHLGKGGPNGQGQG